MDTVHELIRIYSEKSKELTTNKSYNEKLEIYSYLKELEPAIDILVGLK